MIVGFVCGIRLPPIIVQERAKLRDGGRLLRRRIVLLYFRGRFSRPSISSQLDYIPVESGNVLPFVLEVIIADVDETLFCFRIRHNHKGTTCDARQRLIFQNLSGSLPLIVLSHEILMTAAKQLSTITKSIPLALMPSYVAADWITVRTYLLQRHRVKGQVNGHRAVGVVDLRRCNVSYSNTLVM